MQGDTGDTGSIPGSGRSPGGGNGKPISIFLHGKSHGQRSLAGCSPGGSKGVRYDLATNEQNNTPMYACHVPQNVYHILVHSFIIVLWGHFHLLDTVSNASVIIGIPPGISFVMK